jgi:hypothetical protein
VGRRKIGLRNIRGTKRSKESWMMLLRTMRHMFEKFVEEEVQEEDYKKYPELKSMIEKQRVILQGDESHEGGYDSEEAWRLMHSMILRVARTV